MDNPLVVVAPPEHPLAGAQSIGIQRLAEEVFVMREPSSSIRQAMEHFFVERGVAIRHGMQMTRNEAIKQAVQVGLGLSVVSVHTLELELETKRLIILDVEGFPLARQWHLVYRRGRCLSPAAQAFRRFVLEEARGLADPLPISSRQPPAAAAVTHPER